MIRKLPEKLYDEEIARKIVSGKDLYKKQFQNKKYKE